MRATDLADPMTAHVLHLVIEVVAAGQAPAPVTVYTHATATGHAPGEHRRHWLARWLADTYSHTPTPVPDVAWHLKTAVLEAAWRRALTTHARRLLHATEHTPTELLAELADDTEAADELWTRYRQALAEVAPNRLEVAA
ncbi:hypothetical protein BAY60_01470 [Prauserella muralis]|uniref:Uncharacterized protein n=2 Tax=Prauserella muralis TaxID=588067 RepID=A0A2V4BB88_9PSEU|nr:hypothetical protein BAY60_01470 [Prauserella muralis]